MAALWWVNSFVGPDAAGNATSVVLLDADWSDEACLRAARALRSPDSVFVLANGADYRVRFFSPFEGEMSFCGQGLIAVDAVLRERGAPLPAAEIILHTNVGAVRTQRTAGSAVSWFRVPKTLVKTVPSTATIRSLLPLCDPVPAELVIDSGRRRLFKAVSEIDAIALQPASVLEFCQRHELSGVCFYSRLGRSSLRLRVFTVSLAGAEDASTGGAVLGLSALLPDLEGVLEVQQGGAGHALKRGRLLLRVDATDVHVGGRVDLVAQGTLR
jgi:PhzF family phenazine biosynthesis protein